MREVKESKNYFSIATTLIFILAAACSLLLFVGTFTTRVEVVNTIPADRNFILTLGFTIPTLIVVAIIMFIISYCKKEKYATWKKVFIWASIVGVIFYYCLASMRYFLELLEMQK